MSDESHRRSGVGPTPSSSASPDAGASHLTAGSPAYRRANWALFAGALVIFSTLYTVQPLLPEFVRMEHVHAAVASLSLSLSTATMAVGMLIAGSLSESFGRKPLMAISLVSVSILSVLSVFSWNFTVFLVVRALEGFALSGLPAAAMAYLGEEVDPRSLGAAMGLYISGNSVGGMAGRIVAGSIAAVTSWRIAILVVGVLGFACALWFLRALPASRHFTASPLKLGSLVKSMLVHLRNPRLLSLYGLAFLLMGGFVTLYNYISFSLEGPPWNLPAALVAWVFLLYAVGTFSSTWLGGLADRYGRNRIIWICLVCIGVGLVLTLSMGLWVRIVGIALFTFGFFGGHSIASGWVGRIAKTNKAQASGLYLFFYYVGSSVGGTVGGVFWENAGWNGIVWQIGGLLMAAAMLSAYVSARSGRS